MIFGFCLRLWLQLLFGITVQPSVQVKGIWDIGRLGLRLCFVPVKYFIENKYLLKNYFWKRKIFSSVWLHYENCSRKYFHVFGNILKMLFFTTTHTKSTTTKTTKTPPPTPPQQQEKSKSHRNQNRIERDRFVGFWRSRRL